jgi:predicted nucleotidyltransferase
MVSVGPVEVDEICLADLCRQYQVRELALFGSAARGEARADSDIDLLVEFLPEAHIGLMDYAGLMLDLSKLLGRKVDLVSKNGLKPLIRASVLSEMRLLYQAAQAVAQPVEIPDRGRGAGLQRVQATE